MFRKCVSYQKPRDLLIACRRFTAASKRPSKNEPEPAAADPAKPVTNECISQYTESDEIGKLKEALYKLCNQTEEIPIVIGDKEMKSSKSAFQHIPHCHKKAIAKFYYADAAQIQEAIKIGNDTKHGWDHLDYTERISIFNKAADLMADKYRTELVAATMLGQGKTVMQAELDTVELIDFLRFNSKFYGDLCSKHELDSPKPEISRNCRRFRSLDGFVAAISPFNFTSIGGNLAYTPALTGNNVIWKPSDRAMLSNYLVFKIMREAGVPHGVVNFVPTLGPLFGTQITSSADLGGVNFTGSAKTFRSIWKMVGDKIGTYNCFPVLVGECGGKNFHFVHNSADLETAVNCTIRSAFEYSGQKCSSCSRLFVPQSLWCEFRDNMCEKLKTLETDDVTDFKVFTGAVIDKAAFQRVNNAIQTASKANKESVVCGGTSDSKVGYFVDPTVIVCTNPCDPLMTEEIFGPVLAVYVYKDAEIESAMELAGSGTKYGLTGAVFGQDEAFICQAIKEFKYAAGNFYINDKSTGAVVGQQPFSGSRLSGTNDKPGSAQYVQRWMQPQIIKETLVPQTELLYPYMCNN